MEETTQPQVGADNALPQADAGNATPAEPTKEQQPQEQANQFELEVKYNKESKKLTKDEAIQYAQKGMNYDKVFGDYETLKNDEGLKWLNGIAKSYGVSTADLIKNHGGEIEKSIVKQYAEANNLPEDKAKQEIQGNAELKSLRDEVKALRDDRDSERKINQEIDSVIENGYQISDVTNEVLEYAKQRSIPLVVALELTQAQAAQTRVQELEKQLGINNTNNENADSSMGQVDGAEFEGELTEEMIKNMTREQRQNPKVMQKILDFMTGKKT